MMTTLMLKLDCADLFVDYGGKSRFRAAVVVFWPARQPHLRRLQAGLEAVYGDVPRPVRSWDARYALGGDVPRLALGLRTARHTGVSGHHELATQCELDY